MKNVWSTLFEGEIWILEHSPGDVEKGHDSWRWGFSKDSRGVCFVYCGGEAVFRIPAWLEVA